MSRFRTYSRLNELHQNAKTRTPAIPLVKSAAVSGALVFGRSLHTAEPGHVLVDSVVSCRCLCWWLGVLAW